MTDRITLEFPEDLLGRPAVAAHPSHGVAAQDGNGASVWDVLRAAGKAEAVIGRVGETGFVDEQEQIAYLRDHVGAGGGALAEGADARGYLVRSPAGVDAGEDLDAVRRHSIVPPGPTPMRTGT